MRTLKKDSRMPSSVEITSLFHSFSGQTALEDVSLSIQPGETVAIVGRNGAGKTTLVKHMNGLLLPRQGRVVTCGLDTTNVSVAALSRKAGFVFQNPDDQIFCRSVAREIAWGPKHIGYPTHRINNLMETAMAATGLQGMDRVNPLDLSLTGKKMLCLASVLAMDTDLLVLDEPTMGQDLAGKQRIASVIHELKRAGKTVVAVTHDMDFCADIFERIVVLEKGRLVMDGTCDQLFQSPDLLARGGIVPPQVWQLGEKLGLVPTPWKEEQLLEQLQSLHARRPVNTIEKRRTP
ncbi:MAG: ABC transporter ATP-binding protein [Desulfobacteraceae bacterium]|nr:ABC transporter ATP-binding protein [Desulfobacteraceae bacterium]